MQALPAAADGVQPPVAGQALPAAADGVQPPVAGQAPLAAAVEVLPPVAAQALRAAAVVGVLPPVALRALPAAAAAGVLPVAAQALPAAAAAAGVLPVALQGLPVAAVAATLVRAQLDASPIPLAAAFRSPLQLQLAQQTGFLGVAPVAIAGSKPACVHPLDCERPPACFHPGSDAASTTPFAHRFCLVQSTAASATLSRALAALSCPVPLLTRLVWRAAVLLRWQLLVAVAGLCYVGITSNNTRKHPNIHNKFANFRKHASSQATGTPSCTRCLQELLLQAPGLVAVVQLLHQGPGFRGEAPQGFLILPSFFLLHSHLR